MRLEAVGFDVDGTLYPNARMYVRSIPFSLCHLRFLYHFGRVRKEIRRIRPIEDFRSLQAHMLGDRLGVSPDRADRMISVHVYHSWERGLRRVAPFAGVRGVLGRLRALGLKLGVVSDFPVERKLGYLGLSGLWDCSFSSEDIGYLKPNPEPFRHLAACLGVAPDRVLYVGNSYAYDVRGARSAGMKTAHLTRRAPAGSEADLSFSNYAALEAWISGNLS